MEQPLIIRFARIMRMTGNRDTCNYRKEIQTDIKTEAKLKEVLGSDFNANMTVADIKEVTAPEGAKLAAVAAFGLKKKVVR